MKDRLAIFGGTPVSEKKIPLTVPYFDQDDISGVTDSIKTTWIAGNGKKGKQFEREFAKYIGARHAFLVTSGTAALHLAFMALDMKEGEVIIPDFTYTSTALAPLMCGLDVVLCDIEYSTGNINVEEIEKLITPRTKAIVPVDYSGHPCKIDKINNIAKKYNLKVVLDAAQSTGAFIGDKRAGSHVPIACFSFQATKGITTGEGGCIITNDDNIAEKIRIFRSAGEVKLQGQNKEWGYQELHEFSSIGLCYVQSDILASLALTQLRKLDWMIEKRRGFARYLNQELSGLSFIDLPKEYDGARSSWSLYTIRVPEDKMNFIKLALNAEGIACDTHYRALHSYTYYKKLVNKTDDDFPVATKLSKTMLRLPMYTGLTEDDLNKIINAVKKVFNFFE